MTLRGSKFQGVLVFWIYTLNSKIFMTYIEKVLETKMKISKDISIEFNIHITVFIYWHIKMKMKIECLIYVNLCGDKKEKESPDCDKLTIIKNNNVVDLVIWTYLTRM